MKLVFIILLFFIFIMISIVFIISTIWCINPTILTNLKYETISKLKISDFKEPCLFICNHDENPNDQIITCTEATKTKLKLNIISYYNELNYNFSDIINKNLKKLPLFPKYNLLYTGNKLVDKCRKKLEKEHVWLFLPKDSNKTGPYYITHDKKTKVVLVKIKNTDNIDCGNFFKTTFNRKFTIEYEPLNNVNFSDPKEFISEVKNYYIKMKLVFIILLLFVFIYLTFIFMWFLYPAGVFGLKYKVQGNLKLKDFNDGPYLFVMDHRDPPHTDIMIMSEEIHNHSNNNKKFNLVSGKSHKKYKIAVYYTKYNIIETTGRTVKKLIEKIKNNENILIFFREEFKGKGIYHILKETKVPIVLVKKKLLKNSTNKNLENHVLKYRGMEYEINYQLINDYNIENKNDEEFMDWIKKELFN